MIYIHMAEYDFIKMEKKLAKYVNSPESIIYSKSNELYGI